MHQEHGDADDRVIRFSSAEDLITWVQSASDEEIVALYEQGAISTPERVAYGRMLVAEARAKLEMQDDANTDATVSRELALAR